MPPKRRAPVPLPSPGLEESPLADSSFDDHREDDDELMRADSLAERGENGEVLLFEDILINLQLVHDNEVSALRSEVARLVIERLEPRRQKEAQEAELAALRCEILTLRNENAELRQEYAAEFGPAWDPEAARAEREKEVAAQLAESAALAAAASQAADLVSGEAERLRRELAVAQAELERLRALEAGANAFLAQQATFSSAVTVAAPPASFSTAEAAEANDQEECFYEDVGAPPSKRPRRGAAVTQEEAGAAEAAEAEAALAAEGAPAADVVEVTEVAEAVEGAEVPAEGVEGAGAEEAPLAEAAVEEGEQQAVDGEVQQEEAAHDEEMEAAEVAEGEEAPAEASEAVVEEEPVVAAEEEAAQEGAVTMEVVAEGEAAEELPAVQAEEGTEEAVAAAEGAEAEAAATEAAEADAAAAAEAAEGEAALAAEVAEAEAAEAAEAAALAEGGEGDVDAMMAEPVEAEAEGVEASAYEGEGGVVVDAAGEGGEAEAATDEGAAAAVEEETVPAAEDAGAGEAEGVPEGEALAEAVPAEAPAGEEGQVTMVSEALGWVTNLEDLDAAAAEDVAEAVSEEVAAAAEVEGEEIALEIIEDVPLAADATELAAEGDAAASAAEGTAMELEGASGEAAEVQDPGLPLAEGEGAAGAVAEEQAFAPEGGPPDALAADAAAPAEDPDQTAGAEAVVGYEAVEGVPADDGGAIDGAAAVALDAAGEAAASPPADPLRLERRDSGLSAKCMARPPPPLRVDAAEASPEPVTFVPAAFAKSMAKSRAAPPPSSFGPPLDLFEDPMAAPAFAKSSAGRPMAKFMARPPATEEPPESTMEGLGLTLDEVAPPADHAEVLAGIDLIGRGDGPKFDDLILKLQKAHIVEVEALRTQVEMMSHGFNPDGSGQFDPNAPKLQARLNDPVSFPPLDPTFRSTVDSWNRQRDRERVESELRLREQGDESTVFVDPKDPTVIIGRGYRRVLYGDHGPYVEFSKDQVRWESFPNIKRKPPWSYYHEHYTSSMFVKAYEQLKTVRDKPNPPAGMWSARNNRIHTGYADYQPGVVYMAADAVQVSRSTTPCRRDAGLDIDALFPPKRPTVVPAPSRSNLASMSNLYGGDSFDSLGSFGAPPDPFGGLREEPLELPAASPSPEPELPEEELETVEDIERRMREHADPSYSDTASASRDEATHEAVEAILNGFAGGMHPDLPTHIRDLRWATRFQGRLGNCSYKAFVESREEDFTLMSCPKPYRFVVLPTPEAALGRLTEEFWAGAATWARKRKEAAVDPEHKREWFQVEEAAVNFACLAGFILEDAVPPSTEGGADVPAALAVEPPPVEPALKRPRLSLLQEATIDLTESFDNGSQEGLPPALESTMAKAPPPRRPLEVVPPAMESTTAKAPPPRRPPLEVEGVLEQPLPSEPVPAEPAQPLLSAPTPAEPAPLEGEQQQAAVEATALHAATDDLRGPAEPAVKRPRLQEASLDGADAQTPNGDHSQEPPVQEAPALLAGVALAAAAAAIVVEAVPEAAEAVVVAAPAVPKAPPMPSEDEDDAPTAAVAVDVPPAEEAAPLAAIVLEMPAAEVVPEVAAVTEAVSEAAAAALGALAEATAASAAEVVAAALVAPEVEVGGLAVREAVAASVAVAEVHTAAVVGEVVAASVAVAEAEATVGVLEGVATPAALAEVEATAAVLEKVATSTALAEVAAMSAVLEGAAQVASSAVFAEVEATGAVLEEVATSTALAEVAAMAAVFEDAAQVASSAALAEVEVEATPHVPAVVTFSAPADDGATAAVPEEVEATTRAPGLQEGAKLTVLAEATPGLPGPEEVAQVATLTVLAEVEAAVAMPEEVVAAAAVGAEGAAAAPPVEEAVVASAAAAEVEAMAAMVEEAAVAAELPAAFLELAAASPTVEEEAVPEGEPEAALVAAAATAQVAADPTPPSKVVDGTPQAAVDAADIVLATATSEAAQATEAVGEVVQAAAPQAA